MTADDGFRFRIKVYRPVGPGLMSDHGIPEQYDTREKAEARARELEDRGCDVVRTNYPLTPAP